MTAQRSRPIAHYWMTTYLRYFSASLKRFPEKYIPLVFVGEPKNDNYLVYLCPICLTNCLLVDKQGYRETSEFSEDHFPPESVGGKLIMLVCKKCNNEAGATYENSLKEKLEYVSFDKRVPNSVLRTKSIITEVPGWRHGSLSVDESKELQFQLTHKGIAKLRDLTPWEKETNNGGEGWEMKLTVQSPTHEKVTKALLKSAYLYCFYNWGYDFIFSSGGEMIRQVMQGTASYPITVGWMWLDFQTPIADGVEIPTGLCFINKPIELQSLVVNIPMSLKSNGYYCVVPILVPSPARSGQDDLKRIQAVLEANPNQTISFVPVNNALMHVVEDAYRSTWEDLRFQFNADA